jgi:hypothetical protein
MAMGRSENVAVKVACREKLQVFELEAAKVN